MNALLPRGFYIAILSLLVLLTQQALLFAAAVSNSNDSGPDSLREAISNASGNFYTIYLNNQSPIILSSAITANNGFSLIGSATQSIIDGANQTRILTTTEDITTVNLSNIDFINANSGTYSTYPYNGYGGVIYKGTGVLNISQCNFYNNYGSNSSVIYSSSTLTIKDSTFDQNKGGGNVIQTGIGLFSGTNLKFTNNIGTPISNYQNADLSNVLFDNNKGSLAGGIFNLRNATLTDCTFTNNATNTSPTLIVGGAITNSGTLTLNISSYRSLSYTGNMAYTNSAVVGKRGFLYTNTDTRVTFNINGRLIIGDSNSMSNGSDSISSLDNSATIIKTGTGTLILNANNSDFHGTFDHQQGALTVNGVLNSSTGRLNVQYFARIDGTGFIDGSCYVNSGAIMSSQHDGALTFSNLTFKDGGQITFWDANQLLTPFKIENTLTLDLSTTRKISLLIFNPDLAIGQTYTFLEFGNLDIKTYGMSIQSTDYNSYFVLDNNNFTGDFFLNNNQLQVTIIPEPSSCLLLSLGVLLLVIKSQHLRQKNFRVFLHLFCFVFASVF